MSLNKKIAQNTIIQTLGKFISIFLGIVILGMIARYLEPEKYGQYITIVAFLQFFAIFGDMGLQLITVRMLSEPKANEEKILNNILTLKIFTSVIILSLAPIIILFFPYPPIIKIAVSIFTISFFFLGLTQILTGLFQKKLKIIKVTSAEIIGRIFLILSIYLVIYFKLGLLGIISAGIITNIINFGLLLKSTKKIIPIKLTFNFAVWRQIIHKSWPIAVSIIFNLIYLKTDTIILSIYHSPTAVGLYGVSFRFLEILIIIPTMFMGLILPVLSKYWAEKNINEFKKTLQMAFDVIIIIALPLIAGSLFLAKPIIVLIAGQKFATAAPILKIIILASAIVFISTLYGHTVVAIDKQKKMIWAYAGTAFISLIAYFTFIPKYSYFGAAWTTVFAETLITLTTFWMVTKTTKIWPKLTIIKKSALATITMSVILYFIQKTTIFLSLPLAIVIYFLTLYLVGGFSKNFIKDIIKI